jgi:MoxR-like ATPase
METTPETNPCQPFEHATAVVAAIRAEVTKVFVGQTAILDQVLAAFLAGGHVLLEGKPGLGKTHLVLALAKTFGGSFRRIQFTPDLMPSDVTGHTLYDMGAQQFRLRRGPVFTNLLLADEINRAPAKTQAALLEVMQEVQVTIDGESHALPPPFMTLATQNPIEQEGTYPLPEAQLDRFLMKVLIEYPEQDDEERIVGELLNGSGLRIPDLAHVCTVEDILAVQQTVASTQVMHEVIAYAVRLVRATRETQGIALGAGTRGAISLVRVAKSFAVMQGRNFVTPDDIKSAALPVLRHRVAIAPELAISGQNLDDMLTAIVSNTEAPRR